MDRGTKIAHGRSAILKNHQGNEGFLCNVLFVEDEEDQASYADYQGYKGSPRAPRVSYAAPSCRNHEASRGANEENRADPIDAADLGGEFARFEVQLQEEGDEDKSNADDGKVDVEDPALGFSLVRGAPRWMRR